MISSGVEPMQIDDDDQNDGASHGINDASDRPFGSGESLAPDFKVQSSSIDLDALSLQYSELYRVHRLVFIADHCPAVRRDALILAIKAIESTNNVEMYKKLHLLLNETASTANGNQNGSSVENSERPNPQFDKVWVDTCLRTSNSRYEKLDADLRSYKSNSIKESIRRGHNDMGKHFLNTGDVQAALKCFTRTRDYCTSSKHILDMCFNVIGVNIMLKNWFHVQSYVLKAEQTQEQSTQETLPKKVHNKNAWLRCATGVSELAFKRYRATAKAFIGISPENCPDDFLSPSNVALYGGLCALACYNRDELKDHVLSNAHFKQLLETEPQLREVITSFHGSNYHRCFKIMDEMRNNWLLDIYLSSHVDTLYNMIRERALCQYFGSYSSIDMRKMAAAFNTSVDELQEELSLLIQNDAIKGRIDSHNKILFAKETNYRTVIMDKALELGQEFERKSSVMLAKCALVKAKVVVGGKQGGGRSEQQATSSSSQMRNGNFSGGHMIFGS